MNYYPFHLGDYAAHTAHLEPLEDLAYRRMLDAYYLREAPLPAAPAEVARLVRMRQNMAEVEAVLREFFVLCDGGWSHARCDEEIERMQDKQAKARASAAASVNARRAKAKPTSNDGTASVERTLNERSTDVELPTPTPYSIPNGMDAVAASPRKRASRLPDGWQLPKAWGEWALTEYPAWTADIVRLEGQKFADHWHAKGGKDGAKLDWEATWRNWCRSDICQRTHSQKPTFAQQAADVARTTVPSRPGKDQTLEAIEADRAQCGPPPEAVRQKLAELVPKLRVAT